MVVSHLVVEKGGIFWKEGSILGAPLYVKEGIFWEGGVDCGSVTYIFVKKGGILFWEGGREGEYIQGVQHIDVDSGRVAYLREGDIL